MTYCYITSIMTSLVAVHNVVSVPLMQWHALLLHHFFCLVAVFEVDVITVLVSGMTVKVYVVGITTYWFILINGYIFSTT